jgi:hypothetical protein
MLPPCSKDAEGSLSHIGSEIHEFLGHSVLTNDMVDVVESNNSVVMSLLMVYLIWQCNLLIYDFDTVIATCENPGVSR